MPFSGHVFPAAAAHGPHAVLDQLPGDMGVFVQRYIRVPILILERVPVAAAYVKSNGGPVLFALCLGNDSLAEQISYPAVDVVAIVIVQSKEGIVALSGEGEGGFSSVGGQWNGVFGIGVAACEVLEHVGECCRRNHKVACLPGTRNPFVAQGRRTLWRWRRLEDVRVLSVGPPSVVDEEGSAFFLRNPVCRPQHHQRIAQASICRLQNHRHALGAGWHVPVHRLPHARSGEKGRLLRLLYVDEPRAVAMAMSLGLFLVDVF